MINNIEEQFDLIGKKLEDNVRDIKHKINKENAKCAITILGIFLAVISFVIIGVILNFMTRLIYTPIICYIGALLLVPCGAKISLDVLKKHEDIKELLTILLMNNMAQIIRAFAEENNIDLENENDTN